MVSLCASAKQFDLSTSCCCAGRFWSTDTRRCDSKTASGLSASAQHLHAGAYTCDNQHGVGSSAVLQLL